MLSVSNNWTPPIHTPLTRCLIFSEKTIGQARLSFEYSTSIHLSLSLLFASDLRGKKHFPLINPRVYYYYNMCIYIVSAVKFHGNRVQYIYSIILYNYIKNARARVRWIISRDSTTVRVQSSANLLYACIICVRALLILLVTCMKLEGTSKGVAIGRGCMFLYGWASRLFIKYFIVSKKCSAKRRFTASVCLSGRIYRAYRRLYVSDFRLLLLAKSTSKNLNVFFFVLPLSL